MNERDMISLLREKYTKIPRGWNSDRYVRAEHPRYPFGYGRANAIADYIVIDTYGKTEIIGFEVKCSRADWLCELRQPEKSGWWKRFCHRWFLVTPDKSIVKDDLPEGWGHMTLGKSGLRVITQCPATTPEQITPHVHAQLARAIAKTAMREAVKASGEPKTKENDNE